MAVILPNGAVILHIPKTGGTWVKTALQQAGVACRDIRRPHKHVDLSHVRCFVSYRPRLRSLFGATSYAPTPGTNQIVCFVRHPVSWYESWFRYMSHPDLNWKRWRNAGYGWHPCAVLDGLGSPDFNTFVRNVLRKRPGFVSEMYGRYEDQDVTHVGKQENLAEDLLHVLDQFRIKVDAERIRKVPSVHVSLGKDPIEWDEELLFEVERTEFIALLRYGYEPRSARLAESVASQQRKCADTGKQAA